MFRARPREDAHLPRPPREVPVVQRIQRRAGRGRRLGGKSELPSNRLCRFGMIPRDHLDRDPRRPAFLDSGNGFRPWRVDQRHEAEQRQPLFRVLLRDRLAAFRHDAPRQADHALSRRGQFVDAPLPEDRVDLRFAIGSRHPRAHLDDPFRCPLHIGDGRPVLSRVKRRHVAVPRIEGHFIEPHEPRSRRADVMSRLQREGKQRPLHGIAIGMPVAAMPRKLRVVAQKPRQRQFLDHGIGGDVDGLSVHQKAPLRRIASAFHLDLCRCRQRRAHGHLVLRQRARLVGTDDGNRTERFHGGKPPDDRIASRHALHAGGQRDRHHRGQPFGDRRNGQPDHDHEGIGRIVVSGIGCIKKDQRRTGQHRNCHLPREAVHLPHQRRGEFLHRADHAADPAELRAPARRHRDADALSRRDERAGKGHGKAVANGRLLRDGRKRLVGGNGLARQRRFVDPQIVRLDEAKIGRHPVSRLQQHQIARHHIPGRYRRAPPAAQHRGMRVDHGADRGERLFRAAFLDEADNGVHDDDKRDHRGIRQMPDCGGKGARPDQHIDEKIVELQKKAGKRAPPFRLRQAVRTVLREAACRLVRTESPMRRTERGQRLARLQRMPVAFRLPLVRRRH